MNTERVMVLGGVRTPFSKAGGELATLDAPALGRTALLSLLVRTGLDPGLIDEVIVGCVAQPPDAPNLARVIALRANIPRAVPAVTVQRNCASGFEAITQAYLRIRAGEGGLYAVAGVESMSTVPLLFPKRAMAKFAAIAGGKSAWRKAIAVSMLRPGDFVPVPGLRLGLSDPVAGLNMGETAEVLAREFDIRRPAQDAFALRSHLRAAAAADKLAEEIVPAYDTVRGRAVVRDNGVRPQQTIEALSRLRPAFEPWTGTVTAGNSSQITDGAVALLIASESRAQTLGIDPIGVVHGFAYSGCDPERMGLGPAFAIRRLLDRVGRTIEDAGIIEINEAFAVQVLAVLKRLESDGTGTIPDEKLNVNGGAIALGHPVGASGARLVLTALKEMQRRKVNHAMVSLCVGGGQGAALWLERP